MSQAAVYTSTSNDGSMLNRDDHKDPRIIKNREHFLSSHDIKMGQTTYMDLQLIRRITSGEKNFCRYQEVRLGDEGGIGMYGEGGIVADALITQDKGHALFLPIADCVATTIFDPINNIVMLSHLGRHSLEQNGGTNSVRHLVDTYGSDPAELLVWSSPAPNKEVYPIWKLHDKGMKEAWFEQLLGAGIIMEHIIDNPADSATDPLYYSYSEFLKGHRAEDADYCMVAMMPLTE